MFAEIEEAVIADLAFWSAALFDDELPIGDVERLSEELPSKYRAFAIGQLLTRGDTDAFHHNLIRGARVRIRCLERARALGVDSFVFAWGRFPPMVDAIASGEVSLVADMARLLPDRFRPGSEYEEEYLYARGLAALSGAMPRTESGTWVEDLQALEGETPRSCVLDALEKRDVDALDEALEAFIAEHEEAFAEKREQTSLADLVVVAESEVCVEALAHLKLASIRSLDLSAFTYRRIPALSRRPMGSPYPGDV
jgi:hypothetical protein